MLTISETYQWRDIAFPYLFESLDRAVLWACTKDVSLAKVVAGDMSRLDKFLAAHSVGLRLVLFHAVFLNILVDCGTTKGNRLAQCAERYDIFLGRPPLHLRRKWHAAVRKVLDLKTWPEFFAIGCFPKVPSASQMLDVLEKAVANSLTKGYHSAHTKFENVMRSGVSRILLKGDTYSVAPNVKKLRMFERWRFDGHTIFLDASCLVYDFNGALVGIVDYSKTTWDASNAKEFRGYGKSGDEEPYIYRGSSSATAYPIQHSGDVISNGAGQHTIDIDLDKLPCFVCALVFTVSAWTTTLTEIRQPSAHLHDIFADDELCNYKFEDIDTGNNTAVTMCKLQRPTGTGKWKMKTIGHVGKGRAGHYKPILEDISSHGFLADEQGK